MGTFPHFLPRVSRIEEFGTVLTCMDGRPQRKVADYLTSSFGVRHLDTITTAGMVRHIAAETDQTPMLLDNLAVSIDRHGSRQVAVVAHFDCAGNPASEESQKRQLQEAVARIRRLYPDVESIGLWLGEHLIVERLRAT